jgi:hypothetical protein
MCHLLCQICAGPADENDDGTLWLLHNYQGDWPDWPDGMANTHPPLCLRCARVSVRVCPSLRPNYVAVRAHSTLAGVSGALYRAGYPFPQLIGDSTVAFGEPAIRWMRATQLIRVLRDSVIVRL